MKRSPLVDRPTFTNRDLKAGCFVCHGSNAHWYGGSAQGVAARHHDATGHSTWCDVYMAVRYGRNEADARQIDIEDAILATSSGDQPDAIPLPVPDAPATVIVGVSAPKGRPIETPTRKGGGARGRKPEPVHV